MVVLLPCLLYVSVSTANTFVHLPTAANHRYYTFADLARFIYGLLLKIKKTSSLLLVEQCGEYVTPNHLRFQAINEKHFLPGTRIVTVLDKVESQFSGTEFGSDARRFLGEFVNRLLSTVASRSLIGQLWLMGMTSLLSSCSTSSLMGFWGRVEPARAKLNRARLSTILLCRNSGSWIGRPRGSAPT